MKLKRQQKHTTENQDLSDLHPIAHVDGNKFLAELANGGVVVDGVQLSTTLIQGNVFSTDGIHLTPMGYAYVAQKFIESINKTFGATVPQPNLTDFGAVQYP